MTDHDPLVLDDPSDVPAHVDPLKQRAPAEIWPQADSEVLERSIASLAGMFDRPAIA